VDFTKSKVLLLIALVLIAAVVAGIVAYILAQKPAVKLTVASRLSVDEADAIRTAFLASDIAKELNIVDVEIKKLDFNLWRDLGVKGEVDLFLVGEPSIFNSLCAEGALRTLDSPTLLEVAKKLPQGFVGYASNGSACWLGIGLGVYGYIVNGDFFNRYGLTKPESWSNLANPDYARVLREGKSLVSFPLPSKSGTARTTIIGILQGYGWEEGWRLLTAIGALSNIVTSSERARDDATTGVVGLAPAYVGYGLQAERASGGIVVEKFGYLPAVEAAGLEEVAKRTREAVANAMNYSVEFESGIREAVVAYFEASIADPDVQKLLREVYLRVYETKEAEFPEWLKKIGSPLTIRDPITGDLIEFTVNYAKQVSSAIKAGTLSADDFYQRVKEAALDRLARLISELSSQ